MGPIQYKEDLQVALDQNYPVPVLQAIDPFLPGIALRSLQQIDPRLGQLDDWEVVVALASLGYSLFVSNDYHMLHEPRVVPAIQQMRLNVVTISGLGDDYIRSSGALLHDLPSIVKKIGPSKPKIFRVSRRSPVPHSPNDLLGERASKQGRSAKEIFLQERLSKQEQQNPLG